MRILTERNKVVVDDLAPDSLLLRVGWKAPAADERHLRPILLPFRPVTEYAATIEFAKSLADDLTHPVYVEVFSVGDIFNTERWNSEEVRSFVVAGLLAIMRDSDDHAARVEAHARLTNLMEQHA